MGFRFGFKSCLPFGDQRYQAGRFFWLHAHPELSAECKDSSAGTELELPGDVYTRNPKPEKSLLADQLKQS